MILSHERRAVWNIQNRPTFWSFVWETQPWPVDPPPPPHKWPATGKMLPYHYTVVDFPCWLFLAWCCIYASWKTTPMSLAKHECVVNFSISLIVQTATREKCPVKNVAHTVIIMYWIKVYRLIIIIIIIIINSGSIDRGLHRESLKFSYRPSV